jgi:hypothetical protein
MKDLLEFDLLILQAWKRIQYNERQEFLELLIAKANQFHQSKTASVRKLSLVAPLYDQAIQSAFNHHIRVQRICSGCAEERDLDMLLLLVLHVTPLECYRLMYVRLDFCHEIYGLVFEPAIPMYNCSAIGWFCQTCLFAVCPNPHALDPNIKFLCILLKSFFSDEKDSNCINEIVSFCVSNDSPSPWPISFETHVPTRSELKLQCLVQLDRKNKQDILLHENALDRLRPLDAHFWYRNRHTNKKVFSQQLSRNARNVVMPPGCLPLKSRLD